MTIERAMALRLELFDIANSYAGDETGDAAMFLHEACNWILRAEQRLEEGGSAEMDQLRTNIMTNSALAQFIRDTDKGDSP